jgi:TAG lipase / steryl ester hydrolase / phospholipase A2 / LPA acyltransferase|tara:strand:+ start:381 stop:707 length:327 start_codon:yes stop_codon:yes gene_type:complete
MAHVESYNDYLILGSILDKLQGKDKWKETKESHLYDWERIESRLTNMRALRESNDIQGLVHCLRQDLQKNIGGICNPCLYNISKVGTKHLIEEYHNETIKCIQAIYYY